MPVAQEFFWHIMLQWGPRLTMLRQGSCPFLPSMTLVYSYQGLQQNSLLFLASLFLNTNFTLDFSGCRHARGIARTWDEVHCFGHKCARDEHISLISDQKVARLFVEQGAYSKDQFI